MSHRQPLNLANVATLGADQTVNSTTYADVLTQVISVQKTQYVWIIANAGRISGNAASPNAILLQLWDDTAGAEITPAIEIDVNNGNADVQQRSAKLVWCVLVTGGVTKTVKLRAKVATDGDSVILRATNTRLHYVASED